MIVVRPERRADEAAIARVVQAAFADHPRSQQREAAIVAALRRQGALVVGLVAEDDDGTANAGTSSGRILGHVAFSRVIVEGSGGGWFGLGPLAVRPDSQRRGIGRALVEAGHLALRAIGASGVILLGDPAYYGRFGYAGRPDLHMAGSRPGSILALAFAANQPQGEVVFHSAFFEAPDRPG